MMILYYPKKRTHTKEGSKTNNGHYHDTCKNMYIERHFDVQKEITYIEIHLYDLIYHRNKG